MTPPSPPILSIRKARLYKIEDLPFNCSILETVHFFDTVQPLELETLEHFEHTRETLNPEKLGTFKHIIF